MPHNGELPAVSVVIPAYNSGKTIGACLEAVKTQDYPAGRFTVIVVDDGSKDDTAAVIKTHGVGYIYQKNSGPATARNKGAGAATGEILLFTDADCVPEKNWIREMTRPFSDAETIAVKGAYITRQRELVARFAQVEFEERFQMLRRAPRIDMIDTYSAGFRREVFIRLGGFDTSFPAANNEDTELSYRMSALGYKMVFNPAAIVAHKNHPATVGRYARIKFWRGYWRMVVYKRFPGKMLKDTYTPQTLKLQTLASMLMIAAAFAAVVRPSYGLPVLGAVAFIFLLLTVPLTFLALKSDLPVAFITPLMAFVRALSIGTGALWGNVKIHRHK